MKPWQLLIVTSAVAGFLYLAVYAYHQAHPDLNHGYSKTDSDKVSRLLGEPRPVKLVTVNAYDYLNADDGLPVDQKIKVTEWARARKTMGK